MSAYMSMGPEVKGEVTDANHTDWIHFDAMSSAIMRSIPSGAKDQQRTKGETSLGDIVVTRQLDKSSPKMAEACASGRFFPEVEFHFCTDIKNKAEPYLKYKAKDVIITSYNVHANSNGDPLPTEELTLNYAEIEWEYVVLNPRTGAAEGTVPAKYTVGKNQAG